MLLHVPDYLLAGTSKFLDSLVVAWQLLLAEKYNSPTHYPPGQLLLLHLFFVQNEQIRYNVLICRLQRC